MNRERIVRRRSIGWITVVASAAVTLLLVLLYDPFLIGPKGSFDWLNPMFSSIPFFASVYAVCLGLVALAIVWGRPCRMCAVGLLTAIVLALVVPARLSARYGQYQPYARPASGYEMRWLTPPASKFASAFKSAQRAHEKHGCRYTLFGWSQDNVLYYRSDCGPAMWRYDPTVDDGPRRVASVLTEAQHSSAVERLQGGRYPTPPRGFHAETAYWYITTEVGTSPDGRWTATAIRNMYGPGDVVLLKQIE